MFRPKQSYNDFIAYYKITADIDTLNPLALLKCLWVFWQCSAPSRMGFWDLVLIRKSRKKGYHVYYWVPYLAGFFDEWTEDYIRKRAGDDPKRIARDQKRRGKAPTNVLFNTKGTTIWRGKAWN